MSLKKQAAQVRAAGYKNTNEDSVLAHISSDEARRLKAQGGSGRIDPVTGLPHYDENGDGGMGGSMGSGTADGGFDGSSAGYDGSAAADTSGFDGTSVAGLAGLDSEAGYDSGYDGLGSMGFNSAKDSQAANIDGGYGYNSDFSGTPDISGTPETGFSLSNILAALGHAPGLLGFGAKAVGAATAKDPGKATGNMMGSIAGGLLGGVVGGPPGAMAGSAIGGKIGDSLSGYGAKDANGNPDSSGTASAGPGNFGGYSPAASSPTGMMGFAPRMSSMLPAQGNSGGMQSMFSPQQGQGIQMPQQNFMAEQGDGGGGGEDPNLGGGGPGGTASMPNGVYGVPNSYTAPSPTSGQATSPSGNFNLGNLASLLPGLAGIFSSNQAQGNAQSVANQAGQTQGFANNQANTLANLYGPDSPYATQLREQLGRRDAAAGRNSQYGPREVELQARLADVAARNAPNVLAASREALAASGKGYDARQYGTAAQGQTLSKLIGLANQSGLTGYAKAGLGGLFGKSGSGLGFTGNSSGNSVAGFNDLENAASSGNSSAGGGNFWDSWFD